MSLSAVVYVWTHYWAFSSGPLVCTSVALPGPRCCASQCLCNALDRFLRLFLETVLAILVPLLLHIILEYSVSTKYLVGSLVGIALNLFISLRRIDSTLKSSEFLSFALQASH